LPLRTQAQERTAKVEQHAGEACCTDEKRMRSQDNAPRASRMIRAQPSTIVHRVPPDFRVRPPLFTFRAKGEVPFIGSLG
jgi:hypothetical protein